MLTGSGGSTRGILEVLGKRDDIEIVPTYAAFAGTGGPVATADLDRLVSELLEAVQSESHIDGVWRRRRRLAPGVVRTLASMSFSGPWAVHTEYGPRRGGARSGEDRRRGRSLSAPDRCGISGIAAFEHRA